MKQELRKRPYKSLTKISGVGFIKADSILLELQRLGKIDFPFELKIIRSKMCCLYGVLFGGESKRRKYKNGSP